MTEMAKTEPAEPRTRGRMIRRVARYAFAALAAFGVLGAVGTAVVAEFMPDILERLRGDGPVVIRAGFDAGKYADGFSVVVPAETRIDSKFGAVDSCSALLAAAHRAGGADVGRTYLQLAAEGRTHRGATIKDIRPRIMKRAAPVNGFMTQCQSAGAVDAIGLFFDLDAPAPVARAIDDTGNPGEPYFSLAKVTLAKGELIPFEITAETERFYVEWEIEVLLDIDGEERRMMIDNQGQPFRTTTRLKNYNDYRGQYEWVWYEQPARLKYTEPPFRER